MSTNKNIAKNAHKILKEKGQREDLSKIFIIFGFVNLNENISLKKRIN